MGFAGCSLSKIRALGVLDSILIDGLIWKVGFVKGCIGT